MNEFIVGQAVVIWAPYAPGLHQRDAVVRSVTSSGLKYGVQFENGYETNCREHELLARRSSERMFD